MKSANTGSSGWSDRLNNTKIKLAYWAAAYIVTTAIASFGPKFFWDFNHNNSLLAITLNLAVGLAMIWVNIRHLKEIDEMMQKIQLEAVGLALGIGIVVGLSYSLLDVTNVISSDAEISYLVIIMGLIYLISLIVNYRRYR